MTKRQIIKRLKEDHITRKRSDNSHDIIVVIDEVDYFIKILGASSHIQVTLNSRIIWELKKGKQVGIKFKSSGSKMIDVRKFIKCKNKVVIFTSKPYKIMKYLNESDIVDVSNEDFINDILFISEVSILKDKISKI